MVRPQPFAEEEKIAITVIMTSETNQYFKETKRNQNDTTAQRERHNKFTDIHKVYW
jgi:hypothetical protein